MQVTSIVKSVFLIIIGPSIKRHIFRNAFWETSASEQMICFYLNVDLTSSIKGTG